MRIAFLTVATLAACADPEPIAPGDPVREVVYEMPGGEIASIVELEPDRGSEAGGAVCYASTLQVPAGVGQRPVAGTWRTSWRCIGGCTEGLPAPALVSSDTLIVASGGALQFRRGTTLIEAATGSATHVNCWTIPQSADNCRTEIRICGSYRCNGGGPGAVCADVQVASWQVNGRRVTFEMLATR